MNRPTLLCACLTPGEPRERTQPGRRNNARSALHDELLPPDGRCSACRRFAQGMGGAVVGSGAFQTVSRAQWAGLETCMAPVALVSEFGSWCNPGKLGTRRPARPVAGQSGRREKNKQPECHLAPVRCAVARRGALAASAVVSLNWTIGKTRSLCTVAELTRLAGSLRG